jgi:hypothetical protein
LKQPSIRQSSMFEKLITIDRIGKTENLINQIVKILAAKDSNATSLKFISQLQAGKILDAVFTGKAPEGNGVLSIKGHKVVIELPKAVSFEKKQAQQTRISLNKGQEIRVRLESSGSKPALKIISPAFHQDRPYSHETKINLTPRGKSFSKLTRFDNISQTPISTKPLTSARITHIIDSKNIIVDTGSKSFIMPMENTEPLKLGAQVNISFDKTEKGHSPRLVNVSNDNVKKIDFNTLKPYLPARMPLVNMVNLLMDEVLDSPVIQELKISSDVISRLQGTLQLFVPEEGQMPSERQVRQQVESSGINYEAKVRQSIESGLPINKELASDLKGLLLKLDQSTEKAASSDLLLKLDQSTEKAASSDLLLKHGASAEKAASPVKNTAPLAEFRQTIKLAIDNIEINQLSSQVSKQESQPLVIQIPNPLGSGNKTLQLYVRNDSSDEKGEDKYKKSSHNVAFFLDLSFLGKIKISTQIGQERLSVKIDLESEDIAKFINDKSNDFIETMEEHSIKTSVECCVTDKVMPEKDSLIELLVSQNTSLINIKT